MSFFKAWALVKLLEGTGKPDERWGMTQETWQLLGFKGNVAQAPDAEIATAYRQMWDFTRLYPTNPPSVGLFDVTPEPADAVAFQFFINLPPVEFIEIYQRVIGVRADGVLGPITLRTLQTWNGRGLDLSDAIVEAQRQHYINGDSPDKAGLLNRCERVGQWLKMQ